MTPCPNVGCPFVRSVPECPPTMLKDSRVVERPLCDCTWAYLQNGGVPFAFTFHTASKRHLPFEDPWKENVSSIDSL